MNARERRLWHHNTQEARPNSLRMVWSPRAFAFDLDETLADCEAQHQEATRAMFASARLPAAAAAALGHDTTGARTRDLIEAIRVAAGTRLSLDSLLATRHAAFVAALAAKPASPLPGAAAMLTACAARGPVALVTSGHGPDASATLRAIGLANHFTCLIAGEDVVAPKPAPDAYQLAAARLGVAAADVLAFEDSIRGVQSARAAGCRVVAIPNARSTSAASVAADAHVTLPSLADVAGLDDLLARLDGAA